MAEPVIVTRHIDNRVCYFIKYRCRVRSSQSHNLICQFTVNIIEYGIYLCNNNVFKHEFESFFCSELCSNFVKYLKAIVLSTITICKLLVTRPLLGCIPIQPKLTAKVYDDILLLDFKLDGFGFNLCISEMNAFEFSI